MKRARAGSSASTASTSDTDCVDSDDSVVVQARVVSPSTIAAFVSVGAGCGWFVCDSLYQLLANEPETQRGGRMFGIFQAIGGWLGMGLGATFFLGVTLRERRLSFRQEQFGVAIIIAMSTLMLLVLGLFWEAGAPTYPVIIVGAVVGNITANLTYFIVLPLVATCYGGRLIAFVRAGTDTSSLITSLLAEWENPTGNDNRFPPGYLFFAYAGLSACALLAWWAIVKYDIGLLRHRCETSAAGDSDASVASSAVEQESHDWECVGAEENPVLKVGPKVGCLQRQLRHVACPPELLTPVILATFCCAAQWGIVVSVGPIAANMTDAAGCNGYDGKWVFRQAMTVNRCLLPLMSLACSIVRCPRWAFKSLAAIQLTAAAIILAIALGFKRDVMMSHIGHVTVIVCYSLVGGLEGYIYSMAYRFIGETKGVPDELRHSASTLLGLFSIMVVNPVAITVGSAVDAGALACVDPA